MKYCPVCFTAHPTHQIKCPEHGVMLMESGQLEPGTIIREKYRIVRILERGGMGVVYLAEHMLRGKMRALKFLSTELSGDPKLMKRFRQEAQIELRHPNIVEVIDLEQAEDGSPFIAMEFVEGPDLRKELAGGALPVDRALAIARGVAQGLASAHAHGIIHRDVKPENIMLARGAGQVETPKLLDFGIAAVKENVTVVSRTRGLMLTPEYAAPEQWKGLPSDQLDGRVDLYALGGVLHEMLTGRTMFYSPTLDGWMFQHLIEERVAPSRIMPQLAQWPGLDAMVLRMLAKERDDRFNSVDDFIVELDAVRQRKPRPATWQETRIETPPKIERPVIRETPPPPSNTGPRHQQVHGTPPPPPPRRVDSAKVVPTHLPAPPAGAAVPASPTRLIGIFKFYGRPKTNPVAAVFLLVLLILVLLLFGFATVGGSSSSEIVIGILFILVAVVTFGAMIRWLSSGVAFSKVRVHYRAPFAAPAAVALFKALKEFGLKPQNNSDIYLIQDSGRPVVAFAMQAAAWDKPEQVQEMTRVGRGIAHSIGGLPLRMQMVDYQLTVHKDFLVS